MADYGDEYADPWIYSDVIVTHPDGAIEILTYPKEIFPHFYWPVDAVVAEHVYIFGILDPKRHPDRPRKPAVLRLDTQTYEITACPLPDPPVRLACIRVRRSVMTIAWCSPSRGIGSPTRILGIAFDLETHTWEGPVPYP